MRSADELDSSLEGSPVSSAKRPRISLGPRKVHFPENPVSDSVEIPRAPEGKHTRKKLQLWHSTTEDLRRETLSTSLDQTDAVIFPELTSCQEPVASISHRLATGTWAKVLEEDLKKGGTTTIGQLAAMTRAQGKQLRGLKPPKEVTVRNALRGLQSRLRMKAPVVEAMISTEEEEKIKDELFSRPSPTPDEEVKNGEGTLSPALSPIHSPVQRLHNQDSLSRPEREQEDNSLEQTKDKTTSPNIQQGTLPCTEEDEMAEGGVPEPSKLPLEEPSGGDDGIKDVPLNAVSSKSGVEESDDIFQCSMGEEKEVTEAGDKVERELIEVEETGENKNMEITEDNMVEGLKEEGKLLWDGLVWGPREERISRRILYTKATALLRSGE